MGRNDLLPLDILPIVLDRHRVELGADPGQQPRNGRQQMVQIKRFAEEDGWERPSAREHRAIHAQTLCAPASATAAIASMEGWQSHPWYRICVRHSRVIDADDRTYCVETGGTMDGMRTLLHPFEIALQRSPGERPEFRRSARTAEGAAAALDHEYEQLRQLGTSGDLLLIDHDHGQVIVQRRQLPQ